MAYHYRWIIRPKTKGPGFESFFTFICALSFYNFSSHRGKGGCILMGYMDVSVPGILVFGLNLS